MKNNQTKRARKWTDEKLSLEALKYKTRPEFWKGSSGAYQTACRSGVIDAICTHMVSNRRASGTWTIESVTAEAIKFRTLSNFRKGASTAYQMSVRMGIIDSFTFLKREMNHSGYWTKERVIELAKWYTSRSEFQKLQPTAYKSAHQLNILDEAFSHMERIHYPNNYWTKEKVREVASSCATKNEFRKTKAGSASCAKGWYSELTSHFEDNYTGFKFKAPAILYYIRIIGTDVYKIGVTNRSVKERFGSDFKKMKCIFTAPFATGREAYDQEQGIINRNSMFKYMGVDILKTGNTEMFNQDITLCSPVYHQ